MEEEEYDEEAEEEELDDDGEWESDDYEYEDWFAPCRLLLAFLHGFQRLTTPMNFKEFQAMSCVDIGRGCDQLRDPPSNMQNLLKANDKLCQILSERLS